MTGSTSSVVESVRVVRRDYCPNGASVYRISWRDPDGTDAWTQKLYCPYPLCDKDQGPIFEWRNRIIVQSWVPQVARGQRAVAVVYVLAIPDPQGRRLPQVVARIGICDQWKDRERGNYAADDEPRCLFSERYFAESGPGVYPMPIEEEAAVPDFATLYDRALNKVHQAWENARDA